MRRPKVGDIILATDENKILRVHSIWKEGISKYIDFDAKYISAAGIDHKGNTIRAGRAFRFDVGNWEIIEPTEQAQADKGAKSMNHTKKKTTIPNPGPPGPSNTGPVTYSYMDPEVMIKLHGPPICKWRRGYRPR